MTATILIVDDDPGFIHVLARMVDDLGEVLVATSGQEALILARRTPPDLVMLDANMPGLNGFQVCRQIKADPALSEIPVIFVSASHTQDFEVSGFDHGAADFIAKPPVEPLVRARVKAQLRVKQMSDELRRVAAEDALTGLATRRRFDEVLRRAVATAQRGTEPLALLLVDIDHFKLYNDLYGHPAGDACLRQVAHAPRDAVHRQVDLVARIGGEEFALLLPTTTLADSAHVARRALDAVARLDLPHRGAGPHARVSVSIGGSAIEQVPGAVGQAGVAACDVTGAMLMKSADLALYEAKRGGRNRACARPPGEHAVCALLALPAGVPC